MIINPFQTPIATVPGTTYVISFWVKSISDAPASFACQFGGPGINTPLYPSAFDWTEYSFQHIATENGAALVFEFGSGHLALDDVSIAAVPEPATWVAGAVSGLVLVGEFARRFKK